jgi:hypothetical protein
LKTKENPQIEDFQVGVGVLRDLIFSVSLSGAINFWKYSADMTNGELPLDSFNGHQVIILKKPLFNIIFLIFTSFEFYKYRTII